MNQRAGQKNGNSTVASRTRRTEFHESRCSGNRKMLDSELIGAFLDFLRTEERLIYVQT
jgi:hypothetical protein